MYENMKELREKVAHLYGGENETIAPPVQTTKGIPQILVLRGNNHEMGRQYGEKLAFKIHALITVLKAALYQTNGEETATKDLKTQAFMADKYDPTFREWCEGIVEGCVNKGVEITYLDVIMLAVYPSVRWARAEGPYPEELGFDNDAPACDTPKTYCNGLAVAADATKDGKPLVGVSGSPSDETPDRVIIIAYPEEGPNYVAFGTIGKPHCQTGLNSYGFGWAMTMQFNRPDCDWGIDTNIIYHHLVQCCKTKEEAIEWLREVPKFGAVGNFLMTDKSGEVCVVESNCDHFNIRYPGDAGERGNYVVVTNHFAGKDGDKYNLPVWEEYIDESRDRFATISEFLALGVENNEVDIDYIHKIIRSDDRFDAKTKEWRYNDAGSRRGYNLTEYTHQAFISPADMTAYFMQGNGSGTGVPAGSMGEFVKLPLMDDPNDICEAMKMETFFVFYYRARDTYRRVLNASEVLQKDFASQVAFESMLDNAYTAYEKAVNRSSYAYMSKYEGGSEEEYLSLISEALSYLAESQLYSKRMVTQLEYYEN